MYVKRLIAALFILLTVWLAPCSQAAIQPRFDCAPVTAAEECCCAAHDCAEGMSCCISRNDQVHQSDAAATSVASRELPEAVPTPKQHLTDFKRFDVQHDGLVAAGLRCANSFPPLGKLYIWKRSLLI